MRIGWAVPALLLVLGHAPAAGAQQEPSGSVAVLDDPAGDVEGAPAAAWDFTDLVHASVSLGEQALAVSFTATGMQHLPVTAHTTQEYWLRFRYRSDTFDAVATLAEVSGSEGFSDWVLYRAASDVDWQQVATGPIALDQARALVSLTVPVAEVQASDNHVPGPGEQLDLVEARSLWRDDTRPSHAPPPLVPPSNPAGPVATYTDTAEFPGGTHLRLPGLPNTALSLATTNPVRHSNGEATTYHWPVEVTNRQATDFEATVDATAPEGTELRHPAAIQVPAGKTKTIDVYATVPFFHQHGGERRINVTLTAAGQASTLPLRIVYLETPQPAGHHDTVYLHGAKPSEVGFNDLWLNTKEDDPESVSSRFVAELGSCQLPAATVRGMVWTFPLKPSLAIGLDARAGEQAVLETSLESGIPLAAGSLFAKLFLYDERGSPDGGSVPLDAYAASMPVGQLGPGESIPVQLSLPLLREFDRLPPAEGANMALRVAYCFDGPAADNLGQAYSLFRLPEQMPALAPGRIVLPLDEYRDVVAFSPTKSGPALRLVGDAVRALPGGEVLWRLDAQATAGMEYRFEVLGIHAGSATLHGPATMLAGEQASGIAVSLRVPEDARSGDVLEVVLVMENVGDPTDSAGIRLTSIVDASNGVDQADEVSRLGGGGQDAPGPAPHLLALALLAAALVARRPR